MDVTALFGMTVQELAADPWGWRTFQHATLPFLIRFLPRLVVPLLGMILAVILRRRHPAVARRVLLGCSGLFLGDLYWGLNGWIWLALWPPTGPPGPNARLVSMDVLGGLTLLVQLASLWLIASAVWLGRRRQPSGGGAG